MKYLESRPERTSGALTIKGTRIRVAQVINMLANGFTIEQLHNEWFPHVSVSVLRGAVEEATQYLNAHAHSVSQLYVLQVATMGKPASCILRGNHGESLGNGLVQYITRACSFCT